MADTRRLEIRGRTYWYQRAFPTAMRQWLPEPFTGKSNLRVNLKTDSLRGAQQRRSQQDALFDRLIVSAKASASGEAPEVLEELIRDLQVHYQRHGADYAMELAVQSLEKEQGKQVAVGVWRSATDPNFAPVDSQLEVWLREDNTSPRTKMEKRNVVSQLAKWKSNLSVERIDNKIARQFVQQVLNDGSRTPVTVNKHISNLSSYWRWLKRVGVVQGNPWPDQRVPLARRDHRLEMRPFSDEELIRLFAADLPPLLRDFSLIAALTGMRLDEIGRMKAADVDLDTMVLAVQGTKTKASRRTIPIHSELRGVFGRRFSAAGGEDGWLFPELPVRSKDDPLERTSKVSKAFTRHRRQVGVDDRPDPTSRRSRIDFHSFRRWFITKAEQGGAYAPVIEAIVGHAREGMSLGRYSAGPDVDSQMRPAMEAVRLPDGCLSC